MYKDTSAVTTTNCIFVHFVLINIYKYILFVYYKQPTWNSAIFFYVYKPFSYNYSVTILISTFELGINYNSQ